MSKPPLNYGTRLRVSIPPSLHRVYLEAFIKSHGNSAPCHAGHLLVEALALTLSPEAKEPAFLRALRAETSGFSSGRDPDRHENPAERPRRMQKGGEDEDEGPVIVDESGDVVGKQEFERRQAGDENGTLTGKAEGDAPANERKQGEERNDDDGKVKGKQEVLEVGKKGPSKRKIVKIIGADGDDEGQNASKATAATIEQEPGRSRKKAKKKSKPGALSFETDEAG